MAEVMEGRARDAQIAGLPDRPGDEGRAAGRDRRPGADDARARGAAVAAVRRRVRHLRHGRRSIGHVQHLVVRGAGRRRVRRAGREARQPVGVEPVGQRRRVRSARRAVTAPPAVVERCLAEAGIGFFFAPTFHPSMRHAGATRRALGVRTAFNLLGPLTNPAGATRQLVGVPRPEFTELLARALLLLGSERAWVVHGADGIDEISTTGYTKVSECRDGAVNTFYLHPARRRAAEGASRRAHGRRCGGRTRPSSRRVLDGDRGAAARHRAAQRRRGAVHRRARPPRSRRASQRGGRRDRQRGRAPDARSAGRAVDAASAAAGAAA